MSKGPDAFRTISEVADDLDLPQHVLRFWETRFAQIKPLKRGGGRRYYRPDDVDLLRGIRELLYGEGYTIRGVQRILHEQGPRFVVSAGKGELAAPALAAINGNGLGNGDDGDDDGANGRGPPERQEPHLSADLLPAGDGEDGARAPAFDPRQFRPPTHEVNGSPRREPPLPPGERLTAEEMHRLEGTLSELLELKRLLDQVR